MLRLGWQCRRLGFIVRWLRCLSAVAFRHGRWPGSASQARGLRGTRQGWWCVPGPGRGPGRGLGDRETTVLRAAPSARLVGRGVAGAPVRRVLWPVGPLCRTLPDPGV